MFLISFQDAAMEDLDQIAKEFVDVIMAGVIKWQATVNVFQVCLS